MSQLEKHINNGSVPSRTTVKVGHGWASMKNARDPETEVAKWNAVVIHFVIYTCAV